MELSQIERTADGDSLAYIQLDCVGKNLGSVEEVVSYQHLRAIDMSRNVIEDVAPLARLPQLVRLILAFNAIRTIEPWGEGVLPYLRHLDLAGNRFAALPPLVLPALRCASFAGNNIAVCDGFRGHEHLERLDLSRNQIERLSGLSGMPGLKQLGLASNRIASVEGLFTVPSLTKLDLSTNLLENLEDPFWAGATCLEVLSIADNRIATLQAAESLGQLWMLRELKVTPNPFVAYLDDDASTRLELVILHRGLQFIDARAVSEEERLDAKAVIGQGLATEGAPTLADVQAKGLV